MSAFRASLNSLDFSFQDMSFFKNLTRRRPAPPPFHAWGVEKIIEITKIKKEMSFFQNPDPPEACTPSIPCLGSPKTHRNHQNRKRDVIFQKSDPPEAPLAPKKPYLDVKNQEHVKNGSGKNSLDFSFPENAKNASGKNSLNFSFGGPRAHGPMPWALGPLGP